MLFNIFLSYLIFYLAHPIWLIECCSSSMRKSLAEPLETRFLLHTSPEEYVILNKDNVGSLSYAKPFKFIAHGYTESTLKNYVPSLVHAYFYRGNYSVVLVDWADLAANDYYVASVFAVKVVQSVRLVYSCFPAARKELSQSLSPKFLLYTSPHTHVIINKDNVGSMTFAVPFKFICHGWIEDIYKTYLQEMTDGYFGYANYSVVWVDWGDWALTDYYIGSLRAAKTGYLLAELIVSLRDKAHIDFKDIHIIGHSMGCYVAAAAGQAVYNMTGDKVGRVTGLDPAGPMYEGFMAIAPNRMSRDDAKVVDIIHTDNGWFGIAKPSGTIDFFPNGGNAQMPGCRSSNPLQNLMEFVSYPIEFIFCSHKRSHVYYVRSIIFRNITAVECTSYKDFLAKKCDKNKVVQFGEDLTPGATGMYFLSME